MSFNQGLVLMGITISFCGNGPNAGATGFLFSGLGIFFLLVDLALCWWRTNRKPEAK